MISFLINSLGLVAFLALVIYGVHADFEDDAAGKRQFPCAQIEIN